MGIVGAQLNRWVYDLTAGVKEWELKIEFIIVFDFNHPLKA